MGILYATSTAVWLCIGWKQCVRICSVFIVRISMDSGMGQIEKNLNVKLHYIHVCLLVVYNKIKVHRICC